MQRLIPDKIFFLACREALRDEKVVAFENQVLKTIQKTFQIEAGRAKKIYGHAQKSLQVRPVRDKTPFSTRRFLASLVDYGQTNKRLSKEDQGVLAKIFEILDVSPARRASVFQALEVEDPWAETWEKTEAEEPLRPIEDLLKREHSENIMLDLSKAFQAPTLGKPRAPKARASAPAGREAKSPAAAPARPKPSPPPDPEAELRRCRTIAIGTAAGHLCLGGLGTFLKLYTLKAGIFWVAVLQPGGAALSDPHWRPKPGPTRFQFGAIGLFLLHVVVLGYLYQDFASEHAGYTPRGFLNELEVVDQKMNQAFVDLNQKKLDAAEVGFERIEARGRAFDAALGCTYYGTSYDYGQAILLLGRTKANQEGSPERARQILDGLEKASQDFVKCSTECNVEYMREQSTKIRNSAQELVQELKKALAEVEAKGRARP